MSIRLPSAYRGIVSLVPGSDDTVVLTDDGLEVVKSLDVSKDFNGFTLYFGGADDPWGNLSLLPVSSTLAGLADQPIPVGNMESGSLHLACFYQGDLETTLLVWGLTESLSGADTLSVFNLTDVPAGADATEHLLHAVIDLREQVEQEVTRRTLISAGYRHYLTSVSSVADLYVDADEFDLGLVESIHQAQVDGLLPFQYDEHGRMKVNPYGGVLRQGAALYIYGVLLESLVRRLGEYGVSEVTLPSSLHLASCFLTGIEHRVFEPESTDTDFRPTLTLEECQRELEHSRKSIKPLDATVPAFLIHLFDTYADGFPTFSALAQRKSVVHYADVISSAVSKYLDSLSKLQLSEEVSHA